MQSSLAIDLNAAAEAERSRELMLAEHLPLVNFIARQLIRSLSGNVELDDLVSAGTIGLINAVDNFDPRRGLAFSTFAAPRIRGAILDDLRRRDHVSRTVRRKQRALSKATTSLQTSLEREPTEAELAVELGVEVETVWRWRADAEETVQVSLDRPVGSEDGDGVAADLLPGDEGNEIEELITRAEEVALMKQYIRDLSDREQMVLALYYFEGLKLHEIATVLELTESRVSQIRTKALSRLRMRMSQLREL
jgi:RNA polymerase sigma factor for flagellar operon FliA